MNAQTTLQSTTCRIGRSVTFKLMLVCTLILVLLAPVSMVKSLIREREWRQQHVVDEINAKWERTQTVTGPVLTIPYRQIVEYEKDKKTTVTRYIHVLPDALQVHGSVTPQVRYRGIYQAVLYQAHMVVEGRFPHPTIDKTRFQKEDIYWDAAFVRPSKGPSADKRLPWNRGWRRPTCSPLA